MTVDQAEALIGKDPPGEGRKESRYFVMILALDGKEEATQADLDSCANQDKPIKKAV